MPTMKIVTVDGEHVVVADRVMRDSLSYAFERREAGSWVRVATVPRSVVTAVLREIPGPGQSAWLAEDVRTSASLPAGVPFARSANSSVQTQPGGRRRLAFRRPDGSRRS